MHKTEEIKQQAITWLSNQRWNGGLQMILEEDDNECIYVNLLDVYQMMNIVMEGIIEEVKDGTS